MTLIRSGNSVQLFTAAQLRVAVKFEDLIEEVSLAFQDSSANLAQNGLIVMLPHSNPEKGDVYVKTGVLAGHSVYIVKVSPWFAINLEKKVAQGGFVAVFDSETGHTLAVMNDEHYLSDIRTAAAGAVAARALAPKVVKSAAVIGSGVQAYYQSLALFRERPFERLTIWGRSSQKAEALKARLLRELKHVDISVSDELESTVRGADVIITATQSREPLVLGEWLHAGQHLTAVGADDKSKCELDDVALNRSKVFVDSVSASLENGDVYRAKELKLYSESWLSGEIGDVLANRKQGRTSEADITIAKFVGIGALDLVAAEVALRRMGNEQ